MKYRVVKATGNDWEDSMALAYRVFMEFESDIYGPVGTKSFFNLISSQELKKMFLIGEYVMFVAKDNEKIVGMISLRSGNHISLLFVDKKYQRNGVGTMLVKAMVSYLEGNTRYRLMTVNASPYGIPFYHDYGFEDTDGEIAKDGIIYTPMVYRFSKKS